MCIRTRTRTRMLITVDLNACDEHGIVASLAHRWKPLRKADSDYKNR